ncbi:protein-glutamine gamma-glutamyltransferase [Salipaludibacillus sp. HK11]|uniref:protein-glutamine gamma-glutamyltransferase n=1 Tax=Salipaludibacillus sp. HK11 TaxID=3394320 RepID=UPI0039FD9F26
MIQIMGVPFQLNSMWNLGSSEKSIIQYMYKAPVLYSYPSNDEFLFEINLRTRIIESAEDMNESQMEFTIFEYARCNSKYWNLTELGGFLLRHDVRPSDAIEDIYKSSSLYAFECATACIIIFYHAILKSIGDHLFNLIFQNLYLYSWHSDPDLELDTFYADHFLPGDVVYFNNPDFNLNTSWFRGENAVVLSDDSFFGHGIGIRTAEQMIQSLNEYRQPQSNQSAYLTDSITRPSFRNLFQLTLVQRHHPAFKKQQFVIHHNKCSIPFMEHLFYRY